MSVHNKIVGKIVERSVGAGKLVGAQAKTKSAPPKGKRPGTTPVTQRPTALSYHSYDASLVDADFRELLPPDLQRNVRFDLLRRRDPRFFQFTDMYYLAFPTHEELQEYTSAAALSRIHRTRVRFQPLPANGAEATRLCAALGGYGANLRNAWESQEKYFAGISSARERKSAPPRNIDSGTNGVSGAICALADLRAMEECSALVWNLPHTLHPQEIADRFWFYDIKHCFKMYWDSERAASPDVSTLHYFAFNTPGEAHKFKCNFHGTFYNDSPSNKLLVETLA